MKSFCLILVVAVSFSACARFSQTARQQRAYEKYVRTSKAQRNRQMTHIPHNKNPEVPPLETGGGQWNATMTAESVEPAQSAQADH